MTARNTDTKEEIIRIGKELIKLYGYNAFSYADISSQLNMKNAAVHYHFRGKEDLLAGILDNYINDYSLLGKHLQASGLSAMQKLEKFIERYSQLVDSNSICIIGSVAADYNTLPESVKEKTSDLIEMVMNLVEKTLQEGKRSGELSFSESSRTQALLIMTNLAAGVQLARISGKKDYHAIKKALIRQLKSK
ncbi:MAG: TetR/AcrR family transcriptional regulator [Sediminibacterium sp.]